MRKRFEAGFKAKVALEACKGEKTLAELASEYGVHGHQISKWKSELLKGVSAVFENGRQSRHNAQDQDLTDKLHRTIGELKVENDWLKKKLSLLG